MSALVHRLFDTEQHVKVTIVTASVAVGVLAAVSLLCAIVWMG